MYENKPYSEPKEGAAGNEIADIVAEFALCMKRGDSPDSPAAQSAVEQWRGSVCRNACCGEELPGAESIAIDVESYGTGTTDYINDAIAFYKKGR